MAGGGGAAASLCAAPPAALGLPQRPSARGASQGGHAQGSGWIWPSWWCQAAAQRPQEQPGGGEGSVPPQSHGKGFGYSDPSVTHVHYCDLEGKATKALKSSKNSSCTR
ncbi:hypothetical protein DV515_00009338 [Chloebia gouldiae]|uniref:Uncharacterized protein n=1 Tax=Chloebia gouldiae TaxID=44316 RepID=A0A3L8SBV7_CHLGU|nr:hypothetical protein DV515_00009338 [Chloebia gouldiae]